MRDNDRVADWLKALEQRHLAVLTPSETARALRALSSCYVERRAKLAQGGALDSAGKRAAFALFYAPLHFLVTREVVRALGQEGHNPAANITRILDLGCGTGTAGAAWALAVDRSTVNGVDRNRWAVAEANWTYRALGVTGHAAQGDLERVSIRGQESHAILVAYAVNELPEAARADLLPRLVEAHEHGSHVLIIEPIARRMAGWWIQWERAFTMAGGSVNEWRFATPLPELQRQLGRAAGLDPRELTARSLWL
jgi:hypothetical protein